MARPTKYSKEKGEKIAKLIKAGNFACQSAQASGISEATFYRWMSKGRQGIEKYQEYLDQELAWEEMTEEEQLANPNLKPNEEEAPSELDRNFIYFHNAVKQAEAEAEAAAVLQIKTAASSGTWQAAAWFLERKFKERWARTEKIEGTVNHQIGINVSEEELEAAKARLEEARQLPSPSNDVLDVEVVEEELIEKKEDIPF